MVVEWIVDGPDFSAFIIGECGYPGFEMPLGNDRRQDQLLRGFVPLSEGSDCGDAGLDGLDFRGSLQSGLCSISPDMIHEVWPQTLQRKWNEPVSDSPLSIRGSGTGSGPFLVRVRPLQVIS